MKASDLFVRALENEGVEYVFGVPGEENLDFLDSLRKSSIKLILTRHEQGAGFMAATYGRLSGRTGVCLATLGPGATNLVTPAAYAQLGGMPMLMITGQKPITKSKQGRFQIVDVVEIMRPLTKFTKQIVHGHTIPALTREAFRLSQEERPGAVHLELPEDIARENVEDAHLFSQSNVRRPGPSKKSILAAIQMLKSARRPLLLIGAGGNRNRTQKALLDFVNQTQIPFFTTQMGKGVIDERHPHFLGTASLSSNDYLHNAINRSDLILNVGHDVIEKPPFFMTQGGLQVIHINFFSASVDEVYFPQLEVIGDIADSIQELAANLDPEKTIGDGTLLPVKKFIDEHIQERADDERFPIVPQRLVADIRKAMPEDGIITLDNGVYKIWFSRNYPAYQPNTVLLDNALATMGAGLPSAMAAKMLHPEKKVVAICGDGGFMMNSQEIETAVRLGLDLVVMILRDDSYGMIRWKQVGMGLQDYGLEFGNPDFVAYANSYGAKGHRLESTEGFQSQLQDILNTPGVHLFDVPVDYSENHRVLTEELKDTTLGGMH